MDHIELTGQVFGTWHDARTADQILEFVWLLLLSRLINQPTAAAKRNSHYGRNLWDGEIVANAASP